MSQIKAIETRYKGYRFRSRLEARWAVAFDAMGLEWEYEPEGFVLSDGTYYLPDFRIKLVGYEPIWFEVKGEMFTFDEWKKCVMLGESLKQRVLLASGQPNISTFSRARNTEKLKVNGPIITGYVPGDQMGSEFIHLETGDQVLT